MPVAVQWPMLFTPLARCPHSRWLRSASAETFGERVALSQFIGRGRFPGVEGASRQVKSTRSSKSTPWNEPGREERCIMLSRQILGLAIAAGFSLPLLAQEVETAPDDTWISTTGVVESVRPDEFDMDYGEGVITVEFDDGDRDADAYVLDEGDRVTVYGLIDDDFFESRTIEASSVFVENIGTYFYASSVDEEDSFVDIKTPVDLSDVVIQGIVTSVSEEEFEIDTGARRLTVEVEDMYYNPLDDVGYQRVEVGDRVSVTGEIDDDLFEGREVVAESVVTLED